MSAPMRKPGRRTGGRSSSISEATSVGAVRKRRTATTDALSAPVKQGKDWHRARMTGVPSLREWRRWWAGVCILYSFGSIHGAAPVEESVAEEPAEEPAEIVTENVTAERVVESAAENAAQSGDYVSVGQPNRATSGGSPTATTGEEPAGTSQLGQLFYQLQLLRDEVQRLNGALEEQQNQIERLAREQHERYLGLDRRIAELSGGTIAPEVSGTTGTPTQPDASANLSPQQPGAAPTERTTYESAYEMMQRQEYESAAKIFQKLIDEFPNGQYTPNAFYWLGELHRKNGDPEAARQSLVLVVDLYPDHNKVPDALYKLGVVYTQLDEPDRAIEYLDRVVREYPDSTAATLAQQHADELR